MIRNRSPEASAIALPPGIFTGFFALLLKEILYRANAALNDIVAQDHTDFMTIREMLGDPALTFLP